jgi:hypothetical protein
MSATGPHLLRKQTRHVITAGLRSAMYGRRPRCKRNSTGGKQKLWPVSEQDDRYLRGILVVGAHAVLRRARQHPEKYPSLTQPPGAASVQVIVVALANKWRVSLGPCWPRVTYLAPQLTAT